MEKAWSTGQAFIGDAASIRALNADAMKVRSSSYHGTKHC